MTIHGKAECSILSPHGQLFLTVTGQTCTLKQGSDLIRLDLDQLRELRDDITDAIEALLAENPSNKQADTA